jgi:uncharacterized protein (DUF4415 family)
MPNMSRKAGSRDADRAATKKRSSAKTASASAAIQDRRSPAAPKKVTQSATERSRQALLARIKAAKEALSEEEDAAITAAALSDPDAQPVDELLARRGRPRLGDRKKVPVMLRLDPEVLEHFKASGDGWQTRINSSLRRAAGLK